MAPSSEDLYAALREVADHTKALEGRVRLLEDKQLQGEGEIRLSLTKTGMQIDRLISDAESEKGTRQRANVDIAHAFKETNTKVDTAFKETNAKVEALKTIVDTAFKETNVKMDGINGRLIWAIAYATGALAVIVFGIEIAVKAFFK